MRRRPKDEIRALRLEPGDVVVLQVPHSITREQAEELAERLSGAFDGHRVVVIDGGARLGLLRPLPGFP